MRVTPVDSKDVEAAEAQFCPTFRELLAKCRDEMDDPSDNSTKVQWAQMHLRALIAAKEEQRIQEGLGAGVEYVCVRHTAPPAEPPDKPPPEPAVDEKREKVIH